MGYKGHSRRNFHFVLKPKHGKASKGALLSDFSRNWLIFNRLSYDRAFWGSKMSLKSKRRAILLDSEIQDLYGAPKLTFEQKRYYFSLNDPELDALRSIRDRYNKVYFVLLLGYFRVKPVVLNIRYGDVWDDLQFISGELFPGVKLKRKNLSPVQKTRMYRRIFQLLDYQSFDDDSEAGLNRRAEAAAAASIESRFLFDESIDYLAKQRIAIPKYTVLQRVVSKSIASEPRAWLISCHCR